MGRLADLATRASLEPARWRKLLNPGADLESFERYNREAQERRQADQRARADSLPDPSEEQPICEVHGWNPPAPIPGAPRPPCPSCRAETLPAVGEGSRTVVVEPSYDSRFDPAYAEHLKRQDNDPEPPKGTPNWHLWWERQRAHRTGTYIEAEQQALDRIDELRAEERKRSRRMGGRDVVQLYPFDGSRYVVRRPWRPSVKVSVEPVPNDG